MTAVKPGKKGLACPRALRSCFVLAVLAGLLLASGCLRPSDQGESVAQDLRVDEAPKDGVLEPQTGSATKPVEGCGEGPATMEGTLSSMQQGSVTVTIHSPEAVLHDATYRTNGPYFRELELPEQPVNLTVEWERFVGQLEFAVICFR